MGSLNESSARDLITRLVNSIGARDENGVVPFVIAWPRIVGSDLAAHSRVLDIRNNAVLVGVDHPGWLQRLHLEQQRIVRAIQQQFPALEVRYLHFSVISPSELSREKTAADNPHAEQDEKSGQNETPDTEGEEEGFPTAREDEEFQLHLKGLRDALQRKSPR